MNRRRTIRHIRFRARIAAVAVSLGTMGMVGALSTPPGVAAGAISGASAGTSEAGSGSSAAVVTPLLEMFTFGDTFFLPLACSDAGSVVSIIGAQTHASAVSPLVVQLDRECGQLSSEGNGYLQQAIARSQALALINPVVNPLIATLAGGLTTIGTQYGPSLAPFGPTVAGLGGTVAFFEGS